MCLLQPDGPAARGELGIFRNFPVLLPAAQPEVFSSCDTPNLGEIRAKRRVQQGQPPMPGLPGFSITESSFGERFRSP